MKHWRKYGRESNKKEKLTSPHFLKFSLEKQNILISKYINWPKSAIQIVIRAA